MVTALVGCANDDPPTLDYGQARNWSQVELDAKGREADVFFLCPTAFRTDGEPDNLQLSNKKALSSFDGSVLMEKGIYDDDARFFAPYYRQASIEVYELPEERRESYLMKAYQDVTCAFDYYLATYNQGRPLVIAGFSQGADMAKRLVKDHGASLREKGIYVACYAIGWRVTQDEVDENPALVMATGERDLGVVISFNSEDAAVDDSLLHR